jgi:hypothetical protein
MPNDNGSKTWKAIRRAAIACVTGAGFAAGAIAAYCGILQLFGNFHVVVERQFCRSAQLDKATLAQVIQEHGISLADPKVRKTFVDGGMG